MASEDNKKIAPPVLTPDQHSDVDLQVLQDPEIQGMFTEAFAEQDPALTADAPAEDGTGSQSDFMAYMGRAFAANREAGLESSRQIVDNFHKPVAKGALKAGSEAVDFATSVATGISRHTGMYKLGRDEQEEDEFLKWYETPADQRPNANFEGFQITGHSENVEKWMGPTRGGAAGFVEGAAQFGVGLLGAGRIIQGAKLLPGFATGIQGLEKSTKLSAAFKGAIGDAIFFDPWEKKLADMVESGPEFFRNPVTDYLTADGDDSEVEARFKRSLEGLMLGSAIDGFLAGLRVMKVRFMLKSGKIDNKTAEEMVEKAVDSMEQAGKEEADAVARVVEQGDGKFAVEGVTTEITAPLPQPKKGVNPETLDIAKESDDALVNEAIKKGTPEAKALEDARKMGGSEAEIEEARTALIAAEKSRLGNTLKPAKNTLTNRVVVSSRSEAENIAASVNYAAKNKKLSPGKLEEDGIKAWKKLLELHNGKLPDDPARAAELLEEYGFNMRYAQQPQEILNIVKALVDNAPDAVKAARNKPRTHQEIVKAAEDMFPSMKGQDVVEWAQRVFGATERLPEELLALRTIVWAQARYARKLSQVVESNPNNAIAMNELGDALDTLMELHANVSGASSNVARALNAHQIPQGELVAKLGDEGFQPAAAAEAGEGTAEAAGRAADATNPGTPSAKQGVQNAAPGGVQQVPGVTEPLPVQKPGAVGEQVKPLPDTSEPIKTFRTPQGVKEELKAWETKLAHLKATKGDPAAIKEAAGQVTKLTTELRDITPKKVKSPPHLAPMGRRATEGLTRDQIRALARTVFMADGDPAAILQALRGAQVQKMANKVQDPSLRKKLFDWAMTFRINAMLSGPRTHITNITTNMLVMLTRPVEYYWAGIRPTMREGKFGPVWETHPELRQEGADMLVGMFSHWRDAWQGAKRAFSAGQNILDPHATVNDGAKMLQPWGDADWLQRIVHLPSRLLMGSDEFFKQMNYRMSMRAQILRHAREAGITDPAEIAKRLTDDMEMSFGPNGAVNTKALEYARVNTFTNDLEYGWGKTLQENAQKHPSLRIVLPFIRTPTNIFRYSWQRTPFINRLNKTFAEDMAAGGERAALAKAKADMGLAMWSTATVLASAGLISGRGPSDPDLRRQMMDAGWQPYSIQIGGKWRSFRRGDPVFTALGMVADIQQMSGEMKEKDQQLYVAAAVSAIIANFTSKSFMQGMVDAMETISSGDPNKGEKLVGNLAGSFVPNILKQTDPGINVVGAIKNGEDLFYDSDNVPLREARGIIDNIMNRLPGFSTMLEPRRNLFGEKVMRPPGYLNQAFNPFTVSGPIDDESVASELLMVGKAFQMPAPQRFGGLLDLTDRDAFDKNPDGSTHSRQSPYDRMMELMANPPNGMPSLKQALFDLVKSETWKNVPGEDAYGKGGLKHKLASELITQYQQYAWGTVLTEYPALKEAYFQAVELQAAGTASGKPGMQRVMQKYESIFGTGKSPVKPKINLE